MLVVGARAAQQPLVLRTGDRVALIGNSLVERMRHFGHFEAQLHQRFPDLELRLRNFGWPADEVARRQRPDDYTRLDDPLEVFAPTVFICFFGYNESFAGKDGVDDFQRSYRNLVADLRRRFAVGDELPRIALISPTAYEATGDPLLPGEAEETENLNRYTAATLRVAEAERLPFVNLFSASQVAFSKDPGSQFTINGAHLNDEGYQLVAEVLHRQLFDGGRAQAVHDDRYHALRQAVIDLEWHHQQDYRMVNGWYVYGGRSHPFGEVNFPAEYVKIRKMVADRDRVVWAIAQGKEPPVPDDRRPELEPVPTAFGTKAYSEPEELRILTPSEAEQAMTVAPGYAIQTFASEREFPELANPVQLNFDSRGRLWAACMPTYPQWRPGDPKPSDRLLIFEDTDGDGHADKVEVFADDLHCPVGFEFYDGGVLVVSQPRLLWLKDTDGDNRADVRQIVFDGFATDDTHHAIGAFEWTPDGRLVMLEGISLSTTVETPWGPFRNKGRSVAYAFDPRRAKLERLISPCFANAWCYTHNDWGQGFVGDGTGAQQHWATPLSGASFDTRRSNAPFVDDQGSRKRPALGNGFLVSRHFPDSAQGNFFYACVIDVNGILQFQVEEIGSGYRATRIEDLVNSSDRNFRPGDPQIGPDGALYFVDWHNPLIGHMQYSQRDPNRDHRHGRIYRLHAVDRPTVKPALQAGKSIRKLLEQLREYEPRTRYRVRRELRDRVASDVAREIKRWTADIDSADPQIDRLRTEAMWVLAGHRLVDRALLESVLHAETPDARAAALHTIATQPTGIDNPVKLIAPLVHDPHPQVRLEAVRALSFFPTLESVQIAFGVLDHPMDEELTYTLESTISALEPQWKGRSDQIVEAVGGSKKVEHFLQRSSTEREISDMASAMLKAVIQAGDSRPQRSRWIAQLTTLPGSAESGAKVFGRTCIACHRIGQQGTVFGPNLSDAGKRLPPAEIIQAIIYPNEKIDEKYRATNILTDDGKTVSGLVLEENEREIKLLVGSGKVVEVATDEVEFRQVVEVSSMPERLHESMSGREFVDLLSYLRTCVDPPSAD